MTDAKKGAEGIRPVVEESLETFEKIATAAEENLGRGASGSSPTSIVRNTFTEQEAITTHNRITQENLETRTSPEIVRGKSPGTPTCLNAMCSTRQPFSR
jgi:hypothetical protein